jgi:hypothetical protein
MSKSAGGQLPAATPEEIERAEDENTLEKLEEACESEWENAVRDLFKDYSEREILGFGIGVLMFGNEDTPELAPESIGLEMVRHCASPMRVPQKVRARSAVPSSCG